MEQCSHFPGLGVSDGYNSLREYSVSMEPCMVCKLFIFCSIALLPFSSYAQSMTAADPVNASMIVKSKGSKFVTACSKLGQADAFTQAGKKFDQELGQVLCDEEDLGLFVAHVCSFKSYDASTGCQELECRSYCETQL